MRHGAEALGTVLSDVHYAGYPSDNVRVLVDAAVTREAILEELTILASLTGPQSTVVLYFAGHGGRFAAGGDEVYLLPVDADGSTAAAPAATAVAASELAAALEGDPRRPAPAAARLLPRRRPGQHRRRDERERRGCPRAPARRGASGVGGWCSARRAATRSRGCRRGTGSASSPATCSPRCAAALPATPAWVRVWDLFEYLQPRVTADARADRHDQHPVFKADLDENFPVALALGGLGAGRRPPTATATTPMSATPTASPTPAGCGRPWCLTGGRRPRVAVSGDVEEPGVFRVVGAERGITQARRTVVVLSEAYLEDEMTGFIDALAQTVGLEEGAARLLPVHFSDLADGLLPARLRMLVTLDLHHPHRGPRNFNRLVRALQAPPAAGVASRAG